MVKRFKMIKFVTVTYEGDKKYCQAIKLIHYARLPPGFCFYKATNILVQQILALFDRVKTP